MRECEDEENGLLDGVLVLTGFVQSIVHTVGTRCIEYVELLNNMSWPSTFRLSRGAGTSFPLYFPDFPEA